MYKLFGSLLLGLLFLDPVSAQEPARTSTITLGVGGETPTRNEFGESTGPAFKGNYEFRLWKYFAVEAGVDTLLPKTERFELLPVITSGTTLVSSGPFCFACVAVSFPDRTRVTLLPFGIKGILPLYDGRVELFGGFGGAYALHSDYSFQNAWLMQTSAGARVALDRGHHFWLGTSGRFYTNFGAERQEWVSWTADLGLRFGH